MDMSYQIVELEEKTVVGLTARMRNDDPECGAAIGALWRRLFEEGIFFAVPHPADDHSIGLYDAYETDMTGPYDVTIGRAVTDAAERPAGTAVKTIPAGRYAEFVVGGTSRGPWGSSGRRSGSCRWTGPTRRILRSIGRRRRARSRRSTSFWH